MSWLSKHTGVHIGWGPPKPKVAPPPPDVAADPQKLAAYNQMVESVNNTTDRARQLNNDAGYITAATMTPVILGSAGIGGAGAGGAGAGGASAGGSGGAGSFLDWAKNIGTKLLGGDTLTKLLMGGSVAEGAMDEAKRRAIVEQAMKYATDAYDENAPLRDQARSMLANRSTPDLSSIFANPGNVYDVQRRATMTAPGMSPAPSGPAAAGAAGSPPPGGRMGLLRSYMPA